jgi:tartrate dehydrogenase/decarboxylase / D-malate dehydrogenase
MRIAAIPGDGIGLEVLPAAVTVIDAALQLDGGQALWTWFDWGCDRYHSTGAMMPEDGLAVLADFDAIFLGAVGRPDVPDDVSLWGLLIPIRRAFDQYVNLRPIRLFDGVRPRVTLPEGATIDMLIVRENTEGEYSESGGRFMRGTPREFAVQNDIFTRIGVERIARYACDRAVERRGHVTSATKSNGIIHTMPFWDEVVAGVVAEFPELSFDKRLIDALAAELVLRPSDFDVIVASNLYGDILSDLAAAIVGSLGIAASANLNPERRFPSMFEPVHGSAPDIAGLGVANPIAAVWSGALMLEHLGRDHAALRIMRAVEETLADADTRTRDLGGTAATQDVVDALLVALRGEPAPER